MAILKITFAVSFVAFATIMVEMYARKNEMKVKLWAAIFATLLVVTGIPIVIEAKSVVGLGTIGIFSIFVGMCWADWLKNRK